MRAEHHDLVGLVRSWNLADDVEGGGVVVERVLDLHLDPHRLILLQRAEDPPIVLDRDRDCRYGFRRARFARPASSHEHGAARSLARRENREHALILQKLRARLREAGNAAAAAGECPAASAAAPSGRIGLALEVLQLVLGVALGLRLEERRDVAHGRREEDLPLQLSLPGGDVVGRVNRREDRVTRHDAVGARRPRLRVPDDRQASARSRRHHVELVVRPSSSERPKRLQLDVDESPGRHLLDCPIARLAKSRRVREPWTVDVGQPALEFHHARSLEALFLDLVDCVQIDPFRLLRGLLRGEGNEGGGERECGAPEYRPLPEKKLHRILQKTWRLATMPLLNKLANRQHKRGAPPISSYKTERRSTAS